MAAESRRAGLHDVESVASRGRGLGAQGNAANSQPALPLEWARRGGWGGAWQFLDGPTSFWKILKASGLYMGRQK